MHWRRRARTRRNRHRRARLKRQTRRAVLAAQKAYQRESERLTQQAWHRNRREIDTLLWTLDQIPRSSAAAPA